MRNNTHIEEQEKRLKRFQNGPPVEIIETLLNSISNYFNNEISLTIKEDNFQTSMLFMSIHAVALTISEGLFGKSGEDGYRLFLKKFVDGDTEDTKFSAIAHTIHKWRNVVAHQWIAMSGHSIGYDYDMKLGWEERDRITYINPKIYCEHYLKSFGPDGSIWDYKKILTAVELDQAKERLIAKYTKH